MHEFLLSFPLAPRLALIALVSLLFSAFITYTLWRLFQRCGLLDHPERHRSSEGDRPPRPYGMGLALVLNYLLVSSLLLGISTERLIIIAILTVLITVVSFLDDMDTISLLGWSIPPAVRLLLQVIVGASVGITSIKIGYISNILGSGVIDLTDYFLQLAGVTIYLIPLIITIAWYVFVFNSLNWSDGVAGLTSGLTLIALIITGILSTRLYLIDDTVASQANSIFVLQILAILIPSVALITYLDTKRYIIIGDTGTMFLAFMVATVSIIAGGKIATVAAALGVYLVDALYVITRRLISGQHPMKGDKHHHLHFRLMAMGLSRAFVRNFVWTLSLLFGLAAAFMDKTGKIILFIIVAVIVILITRIIELSDRSGRLTGKIETPQS